MDWWFSDMDNILKETLLLDFYGNLLTPHQKSIFEMYYCEDYSLAEISELNKVSRQAVRDIIKRCEKTLNNYEDSLGLIKKLEENKEKLEIAGSKIAEMDIDQNKKTEIKSLMEWLLFP